MKVSFEDKLEVKGRKQGMENVCNEVCSWRGEELKCPMARIYVVHCHNTEKASIATMEGKNGKSWT